MVKTVLYTDEDVNNDFVKRLIQLSTEWEQTRGNRTMYPMCDSQRIRRNENGIGVEIDRLLLTVPKHYAGVPLNLVTIVDSYLDGGRMKAGIYRRGASTATVTKTIYRPSGGQPYDSWKVEVTGKGLSAAVKLYNDVRAGKITPKVSWQDDEQ